jgi:uncharacterized membrane protein
MPVDDQFRNRGNEIRRVEALSDAVFAFSVSLLVASLEVPQTFEELTIILKGAIPFFATVALIFLFWYQQNKFFRHYGVNDFVTVLLNLAYLAVILFYVYPLKFLFSLLISSWTGIELFHEAAEKQLPVLLAEDFPSLVMVFSAGYFVIWLLLYGMHYRVMRFNKLLGFNRYEVEYCRKETRGALWNALVGIVALLAAAIGFEWVSGICYIMIPVLLFFNEKLFRQNIQQLKI